MAVHSGHFCTVFVRFCTFFVQFCTFFAQAFLYEYFDLLRYLHDALGFILLFENPIFRKVRIISANVFANKIVQTDFLAQLDVHTTKYTL